MTQQPTTDEVYKSRKYLLEMLEEQGYNISDYKDFSIHEIHAMYQSNQLDLLLERTEPTKKKAYIKYHLAKTLRLNNINEYIEDLFSLENILSKEDDLVIIIKDEPNDTLLRNLKDIWAQEGYYVRIINIKRLQYNILKHSLVPKHIILGEEEIRNFKKVYNLNDNLEDLIPDISRFSPVGIAIGIRPGQVCKIERNSKTALNSMFYRVCK
jgi:DNA-directed RNA polymerases I, II, and III subunit RPABC1